MIPNPGAESFCYPTFMTTALTTPAFSDIESKALELLSSGFDQNVVASSLQISESRLSQIVSNPEFSRALAEAKYKNLAKHNETDNLYDSIEKKVAKKLDSTVDLVYDPLKLANILQRVNGLKRRGASNPDNVVRSKPTVRLNIPIAVVNHFSTNAAGQVISAGVGEAKQDLVTIQSGNLKGLLNEHAKSVVIESATPKRLTEADGVRWTKPRGNEFHDILAECGFEHEQSTVLAITGPESNTSGK